MGLLIDCRTTRTEGPLIGSENWCAESATATATDAEAGFPASAALTYATYEGWRPTTSKSACAVAFNQSRDLSYIAAVIYGADCDSPISVEAGYRIDGDANFTLLRQSGRGYNWPGAAGVLIWVFDAIQDVDSVQVQVYGGNVDGFRVATVMAGRLTEPQRNIYVGATPLGYGRSTEFVNRRAESGAFLGRVVRRESILSQWSFANLTASHYRSVLDPFFRASRTQPFAMAWRPSTSLPTDVNNPDFSEGDTGWQLSGMEIVEDATNALGNLGNNWLTRTTGTGTASAINTARIPITPGDLVYVFGLLKTSGGATLTSADVQLDLRNSGGGGVLTVSDGIEAATTDWSVYGVAAYAPTEATTASVSFRVAGLTAGAVYGSYSQIVIPSQLQQERLTEAGYLWMTGDPSVSNQRANGMMSVGFSATGIDSCEWF